MKNIKFKNTIINCPICEKNNFSFIGYNGGKYHPNKKGKESQIFKCIDCSLLLPNPLPLPQNIQEVYNNPNEYFSYHASKNWEKRSIEHHKTIKTLLKLNKKNISNYKLLEIGSGRGEFLNACKSFSNIDAIGIEVSEDFINFARKKNITIQKRELDDFIDKKEKFDFIVLIAVIEHLDNPDKYLNKIQKLLKKDGVIYIDCPQEPNIVTILYNFVMKIMGKKNCLNLQPTWEPFHIYGFNIPSLKKILAKNNLSIIKYRIWSPAKPNFKINYKNFVFYFMFYFINYIGNILKLSQNIFLYAKGK